MIKISVVMPVFNSESYLKESIGSILSQSLKDIEIICVDDGSTDDSLNIFIAVKLRFCIFLKAVLDV